MTDIAKDMPWLNVICWGTAFQQVGASENKELSTKVAWELYVDTWHR